MGIFQQRREDQSQWAAIPGEPLDNDPADFLGGTVAGDLLGTGGTTVTIDIQPETSEAD